MWNQVSKQILMQLWFSEALHIGLNYSHCMPHLHRTKNYWHVWNVKVDGEKFDKIESQRISYSSAPLQLLSQKVVWASLHSSWTTETKLLTWRNKIWGEYIQSVQSNFKTILNHAGLTNNSNPKLKIISEELKNNHELPKPLPFNPISTVLYKGTQVHAII